MTPIKRSLTALLIASAALLGTTGLAYANERDCDPPKHSHGSGSLPLPAPDPSGGGGSGPVAPGPVTPPDVPAPPPSNNPVPGVVPLG